MKKPSPALTLPSVEIDAELQHVNGGNKVTDVADCVGAVVTAVAGTAAAAGGNRAIGMGVAIGAGLSIATDCFGKDFGGAEERGR